MCYHQCNVLPVGCNVLPLGCNVQPTSCNMQPVIEEQPTCLKSAGKNIVDLLGKSYVLELLYFLKNHNKPVRFNEIKHKLSITATTLSRRLEEFVNAGLVTREVFAEVPARVEYSLSKKGESLGTVLRHLFEWVENNNL